MAFDHLKANKSAIAIGGARGGLTFSELSAMADRMTSALTVRSLVFILCKNTPEAVASYLGLLRNNHVGLLLSSTIESEFFQNLLQIYQPNAVFLPRERIDLMRDGSLVIEEGPYSLVRIASAPRHELFQDLALLLTTSGSTGSPKLVRLSIKNLRSNAAAIANYLNIDDRHRPITTMPMNYSYGLSIINSHLFAGARILLTEESILKHEFWDLLYNEKATSFGGVPYIYEILKKLGFERLQRSNVRVLTQAGGKLSSLLWQEIAAFCTGNGIQFYPMYGQTEATARIAYLEPTQTLMKVGSIGRPIPGGLLWIEDEFGQKIHGPRELGELIYQGDNVCLGYAESKSDLARGDDNFGVLRTGDLATQDAEGFYSIVGRKNRFLKIFGHRVGLVELERLLRDRGFECACSGEDENLMIYFTDRDALESISKYLTQMTGIHHSGFSLKHVGRIPRSDSGKVLYAALDRPTGARPANA